jgi:hypothetical protein
MIARLARKVGLLFSPPKEGDVYMGSAFYFLTGRPMEQVLHGLRDMSGEAEFAYWESNENYRLTIDSAAMPYYILTSEVLVRKISEGSSAKLVWRKRCQPRRVPKDTFHEWIKTHMLVKSK